MPAPPRRGTEIEAEDTTPCRHPRIAGWRFGYFTRHIRRFILATLRRVENLRLRMATSMSDRTRPHHRRYKFSAAPSSPREFPHARDENQNRASTVRRQRISEGTKPFPRRLSSHPVTTTALPDGRPEWPATACPHRIHITAPPKNPIVCRQPY